MSRLGSHITGALIIAIAGVGVAILLMAWLSAMRRLLVVLICWL